MTLEELITKLESLHYRFEGHGMVYRSGGYTAVYSSPDLDKILKRIEDEKDEMWFDLEDCIRDAVYEFQITSWG